ncbi:MAG: helix-turn-helix domain-containing protein [Bacteroidota bacterium]
MVYKPQLFEVQKHIDHYWILDESILLDLGSTHMYAYPGITPDMIIVLEGHYSLSYGGKKYKSDRSLLFSFIHEKVHIDFSALKRCIVVKFKSRGLSSLKPFVRSSADTIMRNSVAFTKDAFGAELKRLNDYLKTCEPKNLVLELDNWFAQRYRRQDEGFVVEMSQEVSKDCNLGAIMKATGYSYSTIERYFKKETGLTPKSFQTLQRFKKVLRELSTSANLDWQHYILEHGYYDQSHFIKEMKKFTGYSPSALVHMPSFIKLRPHYI